MSIADQIRGAFPGIVISVEVNKDVEYHGQKATGVTAILEDGRTVTGTFTTESKPGFGGVEFESKKDVAGLMISKIQNVLAGTAEL